MALQGTHTAIGAANTFATAAAHQTALDATEYKNLDQTNCQSDVGVVTVGTSAPSGTTEAGVAIPYAGNLWQDTNDVTNGPRESLKFRQGTDGAWVGLAQAIYSSTAPTGTAVEKPGMLWRDTTLHIWRRYESNTTAPDGVAGWHPIPEAWQLWKNESGGTVPKGAPVVHKQGGAVERCFTTATLSKHMGVVGVTAETVTDNSYGVLATVAGGAQVDVLLTVATYGAAEKGDVVVVDETAGYCRQAGLRATVAANGAVSSMMGVQMGAFAELLSVATTTGLHPARMLGSVGSGLVVVHQQQEVYSDTTPTTLGERIDASTSPVDAAHLPIAAWQGYLLFDGAIGAYTDWNLKIGKTAAGSGGMEIGTAAGPLSNPEFVGTFHFPWSFTSLTSSVTLPGNTTLVTYEENGGSVTWTTFKLFRTGYIC